MFDEIIKLKEEFDAKVEAVGQEAICNEIRKQLLELPDGVAAVRWQQYTPYFNDGEACTFRVHDPEFKLTDEFVKSSGKDLVSDYDDLWYDSWSISYNEMDACTGLSKFIQGIPEEVMEAAFGDHVEIEVSRTGFTVDEVSHD